MYRQSRKTRTNVAKRSKSARSKTPYTAKRSRGSYANTTKAISKPFVGLGQSARTVLKTVALLPCSAAANGIYNNNLHPGDCYNPIPAAAGLQPTLFDQWAATYGRYVVENAWVKIEVATKGFFSGGTNSATCFAIYPATKSTTLAGFNQYASQDFAQSVLIGPTDTTSTNTITLKLDHAKVLGRKGPVTAEDNGALVTSSPASGQFMVCPFILYNTGVAVYDWVLRITMYQTVYFDQRKSVVDA